MVPLLSIYIFSKNPHETPKRPGVDICPKDSSKNTSRPPVLLGRFLFHLNSTGHGLACLRLRPSHCPSETCPVPHSLRERELVQRSVCPTSSLLPSSSRNEATLALLESIEG